MQLEVEVEVEQGFGHRVSFESAAGWISKIRISIRIVQYSYRETLRKNASAPDQYTLRGC